MGGTDVSRAGQLMFRCELTLKRPLEGSPGLGETEDSVCWLELLAQGKAGVLSLLFWVSADTPLSPQCWSVCPQGALSVTLSLHHWQQLLLNLLALEL